MRFAFFQQFFFSCFSDPLDLVTTADLWLSQCIGGSLPPLHDNLPTSKLVLSALVAGRAQVRTFLLAIFFPFIIQCLTFLHTLAFPICFYCRTCTWVFSIDFLIAETFPVSFVWIWFLPCNSEGLAANVPAMDAFPPGRNGLVRPLKATGRSCGTFSKKERKERSPFHILGTGKTYIGNIASLPVRSGLTDDFESEPITASGLVMDPVCGLCQWWLQSSLSKDNFRVVQQGEYIRWVWNLDVDFFQDMFAR